MTGQLEATTPAGSPPTPVAAGPGPGDQDVATDPGRSSWASARAAVQVAVAVALGLAIGLLTSFGQAALDAPFAALVNSASAWLVAPFVIGHWARSGRTAAGLGFLACAAQLVGYETTSELRGFGTGGSVTVLWGACAVVGGPVFGAAGRLRRIGTPTARGVGGTALPAAFLAEGAWAYGHQLHYWSTMALWFAIAVVLLATTTRGLRERRWLGATFLLALAGEVVLALVYRQAF